MNVLEIARLSTLFLHFVGLAAIVGPFLLQVSGRRVLSLRTMLIGSVLQVLTGLALVALRSAEELATNPVKYGVKLAVAVLVLAAMVGAAVMARRASAKNESPRSVVVLFRVAGILALSDIAVAVGWQ